MSYLIFQVKRGIDGLPTAEEGLRTDTIAGNLDADATAASAVVSLGEARRNVDISSVHLRNALNSAARIYLEPK